jgi:hypothetical protein
VQRTPRPTSELSETLPIFSRAERDEVGIMVMYSSMSVIGPLAAEEAAALPSPPSLVEPLRRYSQHQLLIILCWRVEP